MGFVVAWMSWLNCLCGLRARVGGMLAWAVLA